MLQTEAALLCLFISLISTAVYSILVTKNIVIVNMHDFFSAKNTQSSIALGWSFFASGMGSWVLFAFPEIGAIAGSWGMIGYTLSMCLPLLVLAKFGPKIRSTLGDGITWSDYIHQRYGRFLQLYVALVSLFYQFISISAEFSGVGSLFESLSPGTSKLWPIIGVALTTTFYTYIGGLRSSIATDVWQGAGVLVLVLLVCIAMFVHADIPDGAWGETKVAAFTVNGFYSLVTLCIAVTTANLFLTGFWQRVWAAKDDKQLRQGCYFSCILTVPFTIALTMSGMVFVLVRDENTDPFALPFFYLLSDMGKFWQCLVILIVVALVASSADTIQNGMAAEVLSNFDKKLTISQARIIGALLNVPAVLVATLDISVLELFLIADLFTTATVGPMLLGHWNRTHPVAALIGCVSGLLSVFIHGLVLGGSVAAGFDQLMVPEGLYSVNSMVTFILALTVPILVTVLLSLLFPPIESTPHAPLSDLQYSPCTTPTSVVPVVVQSKP